MDQHDSSSPIREHFRQERRSCAFTTDQLFGEGKTAQGVSKQSRPAVGRRGESMFSTVDIDWWPVDHVWSKRCFSLIKLCREIRLIMYLGRSKVSDRVSWNARFGRYLRPILWKIPSFPNSNFVLFQDLFTHLNPYKMEELVLSGNKLKSSLVNKLKWRYEGQNMTALNVTEAAPWVQNPFGVRLKPMEIKTYLLHLEVQNARK